MKPGDPSPSEAPRFQSQAAWLFLPLKSPPAPYPPHSPGSLSLHGESCVQRILPLAQSQAELAQPTLGTEKVERSHQVQGAEQPETLVSIAFLHTPCPRLREGLRLWFPSSRPLTGGRPGRGGWSWAPAPVILRPCAPTSPVCFANSAPVNPVPTTGLGLLVRSFFFF